MSSSNATATATATETQSLWSSNNRRGLEQDSARVEFNVSLLAKIKMNSGKLLVCGYQRNIKEQVIRTYLHTMYNMNQYRSTFEEVASRGTDDNLKSGHVLESLLERSADSVFIAEIYNTFYDQNKHKELFINGVHHLYCDMDVRVIFIKVNDVIPVTIDSKEDGIMSAAYRIRSSAQRYRSDTGIRVTGCIEIPVEAASDELDSVVSSGGNCNYSLKQFKELLDLRIGQQVLVEVLSPVKSTVLYVDDYNEDKTMVLLFIAKFIKVLKANRRN